MKIIVFTGAGISAESGLKTFRGEDGLWEDYSVEEVATLQAWRRNPELVQEFYNIRRKAVSEADPNAAHYALAELEKEADVCIITQNIDDLHERAGSRNIVHLHGLITYSQSSIDPGLRYPIAGRELKMGTYCEKGSQLRPHVVWFGEDVPMMDKAMKLVQESDIFITIGTSLQVYPAANLIHFLPETCEKYLIDPNAGNMRELNGWNLIVDKAAKAVPELIEGWKSTGKFNKQR